MRRVYVETEVVFRPDGQLVPKAIIWEDGRRFAIDRVRLVGMRASRTGLGALLYTCRIGGQSRELFCDVRATAGAVVCRFFVETGV